ncbi:MAG TPA: hypothetical protein VHC22_01645 [Pirellulales bacterium]|nr:hypothetical protein [Pirellulales bacterium]
MSPRRLEDDSHRAAEKSTAGHESNDGPQESKTVSFRWKADAKVVQQILDAAAKGALDQIPIKLVDSTVFLSIDEISVAADIPGVSPQKWRKREQSRDGSTSADREEGNIR